jgi:SAM-dependent methyltransferase
MYPVNILYRQSAFPILQNRVYDTPEEAIKCPSGDIELVEDSSTGLVYNTAFQPETMIYDSNYNNEQALSSHFRQHLEQVSQLIEAKLGRDELVEVGCGKGFFLEMLADKGFDITGFDPAYEGDNDRVVRAYFSPSLMRSAKAIVLRHVLEHVQDPVDFLEQLKYANGGKGKIYIEVPCFDWICEHRAWFDIFYEHVNYFRLTDFDRIFGRVIESGRIFGGQYLYVIADLSTVQKPCINLNERVIFPEDFTCCLAGQIGSEATKIAIWGGASKGVIFSLLKARTGQVIDMAIDINPAKQGKYLPGSALPVLSPDQAMRRLPPASTIYVMNSNYMDEIRKLTLNQYKLIGIDHE